MLSFLLPTCALLLAPSQPAGAPRCVPPLAKLAPVPSATAIAGIQPTLDELSSQLAAVRALRPSDQSPAVQASLWRAAGLNPTFKVSGVVTGEPSFTRLFDHATWSRYTGISPFRRWCRAVRTWRFSTVLAALWPIILVAAAWAFLVASLPSAWLPRTAPGPHGLMGSAIGLLLVFRTNNTYQRLNEARLLWGRAVYLCREIAQNAATALLFDEAVPEEAEARQAAANVCRLLAAWCWELNAKLTGPSSIRASTVYSDDVLQLLLPEAEAAWMAKQRSRPLVLLGALRRTVHSQFKNGNLPSHLHRKMEEDMRDLDLVVGGCERLFSSPVPPTMSRHVVRCLLLWLATMPFVLVGTMRPLAIAGWVSLVGYIFVGIEEVGVQVEQPFEIIPMTQLCNIIMANLEEAISAPPGLIEVLDDDIEG